MPRYASFGLRLVAFLIDALVLGTLGALLSALIRLDLGWLPGQLFPSVSTPGSILGLLVFWAYTIGLTKRYGGTLGKLALGLVVIPTDGRPLDWLTVIVRETIGKFVSAVTFGLGFWWVSWDARKQGFHDKVADTFVVLRRPSH